METLRDSKITSELERTVARNLLRYAVGQARDFACPHCGEMLDCGTAVLVSGPNCQWFGCAKCHGQGARSFNDGKWSVYDGRDLFAREVGPFRNPAHRRRVRAAAKPIAR